MFRFVLLLILPCLALSPAHADDQLTANQLHAIRSTAFTVCSNVLLYHSSDGYGGDVRNLEAYQVGMAWLGEQIEPELVEPLRQMSEQIALLERNPSASRLLKPRWVTPLLQAQAQLDGRLAERYAQLDISSELRLLHEQSLDASRMLLLYQTRAFGSLAVYFMEVDDDISRRLDARFVERSQQLMTLMPGQAQDLTELGRHYQFIRSRLLVDSGNWLAAGVGFYLGRIVESLDRMAENWNEVTEG
jgi:hypothetical protein